MQKIGASIIANSVYHPLTNKQILRANNKKFDYAECGWIAHYDKSRLNNHKLWQVTGPDKWFWHLKSDNVNQNQNSNYANTISALLPEHQWKFSVYMTRGGIY